MTKMKELYEKVTNDKELQVKFFEIMKNAKEAGEEATSEKLIGFAKDAGYDITLDEMKDFFKEMAESKEGTLTEAELDMVAGGKSDTGIEMIVMSVLTVGVFCAAASLGSEIGESGACAELFQ